MLSFPSILLSWVLTAVLAGAGSGAIRCDCTPLAAPDAFEQAALVFTGRVILGEALPEEETLFGIGSVRYLLAVEDGFKGVAGDTVEVWGGAGSGHCLYDFSIGQRYVVFAFRRRVSSLGRDIVRDVVPMARCTPTDRLSRADETLDYLRSRHE